MDYMCVWFCGVAVITGVVFFVVLWHQWQYALSQADHWQTRWAAADERVNVALNKDRMMRTQLDEALDRLDRAIEQRDAATTALNDFIKKADELKAQVEEMRNKDKDWRAAYDLWCTTTSKKERQIESLEKELDGKKNELINALTENKRLQSHIKGMEAGSAAMKGHRDDLKAELTERNAQLLATGKVVTAYQGENADLRAQLADRDREISELRKLSPRYAELTKQVAEKDRWCEETRAEDKRAIGKLEQVIADKGRTIANKDRMISDFSHQLRSANELLKENEKQILQMYHETNDLKKQLTEKSNRINELTVAQAPAPNQPTFMTTDQCDEIRKGDRQYIDELKATIQGLRQTTQDKDRKITSVQKAYSDAGYTIRELLTERSKLEQRIIQMEKEIAHLESSLLPHMGSMHRADVDTMVAAHKKQVDELIRSVAQKQKTIEEMDSQIKQNLNQIKALMEVRDNFKEQLRRKDVRVTELEKQNKQLVEARHLVYKLRNVLQIQPVLDEEMTVEPA